MKTCPYCMGEIPDAAEKCKYCGEWVVNKENSEYPVKNNKSIKWILIVVAAVLVIFVLLFPSIKKNINRQKNIETLNKLYDDTIAAGGKMDISGAFEALDTIVPENSREAEAFKEVSEFVTEYTNKMNSFSDDLFYIEDKDLNNTYLVNLAIDQYKEYRDVMSNYIKKCKEIGNKYGLFTDKSAYSYYDLVNKIEEFTSQEIKFANKSIEFYSYVLSIQDDFYYSEADDVIYFYSDAPEYSLNKFNTLSDEYGDLILETIDVEDKYNDYYVDYLKYNKNKLNN